MRISDWSSDVCSSDLRRGVVLVVLAPRLHDLVVARQRNQTHDILLGDSSVRPLSRRRPVLPWLGRSEERRVGKECVSTCRSRWSPYHQKKKNTSRQHNHIHISNTITYTLRNES